MIEDIEILENGGETMKKDYLKIVNYYGIQEQVKHWYTEVFELSKEIVDKENNRDIITPVLDAISKVFIIDKETKIDRIKSELADNFNFLRQIQYYYGISDQELIKEQKFKNKRTLNRMEEGNE